MQQLECWSREGLRGAQPPHLTDEETEAQRQRQLAQAPTGGRCGRTRMATLGMLRAQGARMPPASL